MHEVTRELEERQYLGVQNSNGSVNKDSFECVFTYGATNAKKNPLDDIDNEKLIGDLEGKKALM